MHTNVLIIEYLRIDNKVLSIFESLRYISIIWYAYHELLEINEGLPYFTEAAVLINFTYSYVMYCSILCSCTCMCYIMYITCVQCTVVVELHLATSGLQSPAK